MANGNEVEKLDKEAMYLQRWAKLATSSGVIPQGTTKEQAMAIIATGKEINLQPFQSLRMMSFVRGKLCMEVKLQLALAKQRGVKVAKLKDSEHKCEVTLTRGDEAISCEYTLADAKKAGLVKKDSNWEKYERQMLRWRAIGDALRIIAPDLTNGLLSPEEALTIKEIGQVQDDDYIPMPEAVDETENTDSVGAQEKTEDVDTDMETLESGEGEGQTQNYPFLQRMGEYKKKLGTGRYYEEIGHMGVEHANEIFEPDQQSFIENRFKDLISRDA